MAGCLPYVPTAEAAFIGGVSAPQMNRLVDEELVPSALLALDGGGRRFARLAAAFARFFFDTEPILVASARKKVLAELTARVERLPARDRVLALQLMPREFDWKFVDVRLGVAVDVSSFVSEAMARARDVDNADKLVAEDAEVLGGIPCFAGTRVPIDHVLGSLDKGLAFERLVASWPFLTEAHVDAARVYAQVHPRRGRPRGAAGGKPPVVRKVSRIASPAST
ncbi:MAG TPA: DUF433 domain-containing protein [Burkholderiaceae bacterium]